MRQLSHDLSSSYDSLSVDPLEGIFKDATLRGTRAFDPWEISRTCHTTATQAPMGIQCGPLASNSLAGLPMLAAPSTAIRAMKAIRASQAISALHQCDFAFFLLRPWRAFFLFLSCELRCGRALLRLLAQNGALQRRSHLLPSRVFRLRHSGNLV